LANPKPRIKASIQIWPTLEMPCQIHCRPRPLHLSVAVAIAVATANGNAITLATCTHLTAAVAAAAATAEGVATTRGQVAYCDATWIHQEGRGARCAPHASDCQTKTHALHLNQANCVCFLYNATKCKHTRITFKYGKPCVCFIHCDQM